MSTNPPRYSADALRSFALQLLLKSGLEQLKAEAVADILLEGDLLGHDTHGLNLLRPYLMELEAGTMTKSGKPIIVSDAPAAQAWDGQRLPGQWLVLQAMQIAAARAKELGTGTMVIRRSHHIGCLAAYLKRATDQGLLMLLLCSDPNSESVAPFGGTQAVFTPNPIAAGIPIGENDAALLDISASLTTNGMTARLHKEGKRTKGAWMLDAQGMPTDDPAALFNSPKGTILPLGGTDAGHKGYALALLIESFTAGLAGHGRADAKEGWGATVFLQLLDPERFGGKAALERQMQHIAELCRNNRPREGVDRVRLPGERGLTLRTQQLTQGVALHESIMPQLVPWAEKLGVALPKSI